VGRPALDAAPQPRDRPRQALLAPKKKFLAVDETGLRALLGDAGAVRLWDLEAGRPLGPAHLFPDDILGHTSTRQALLLPEGDAALLLTNTAWSFWQPGRAPQGLPAPAPLCAAVGPDGGAVLVQETSRDWRLWDVRAGRALSRPLPLGMVWPGSLAPAVFDPRSSLVLLEQSRVAPAPSAALAVQLFCRASRHPVGPTLRVPLPSAAACSAALTPDAVLLACVDGAVRALPLPAPVPGDGERLVVWMELLTGHRLDDADVLLPLTEAETQERRQRLRDLGGPPLP
jgi:hypothetical protein